VVFTTAISHLTESIEIINVLLGLSFLDSAQQACLVKTRNTDVNTQPDMKVAALEDWRKRPDDPVVEFHAEASKPTSNYGVMTDR
jgi:hypothetical protein